MAFAFPALDAPAVSLSVQAQRSPERQAAGGKAGGSRERRRSEA